NWGWGAMITFENSTVMRGGVTSNRWYGGTQRVRGAVDSKGLQIRFVLPSKGGGHTDILVRIGVEDLRTILSDVGRQLPSLADVLAKAAYAAVVRLKRKVRSR